MPKTDTPALILSLPGQRETLTEVAVTTADECKTACQTNVDEATGATNYDWCCSSVADTSDSSLACTLFFIGTEADNDIRFDAEDEVDGTVTSSAWAWAAAVAMDDLPSLTLEESADDEEATEDDDEEATEDDEDMSVRMTASAVAAASIAILAM